MIFYDQFHKSVAVPGDVRLIRKGFKSQCKKKTKRNKIKQHNLKPVHNSHNAHLFWTSRSPSLARSLVSPVTSTGLCAVRCSTHISRAGVIYSEYLERTSSVVVVVVVVVVCCCCNKRWSWPRLARDFDRRSDIPNRTLGRQWYRVGI